MIAIAPQASAPIRRVENIPRTRTRFGAAVAEARRAARGARRGVSALRHVYGARAVLSRIRGRHDFGLPDDAMADARELLDVTRTTAAVLASDLADHPVPNAKARPERALATAARRRRWGREASLSALALGAVGCFFVVARSIAGDEGTPFDRKIVRFVGRARHPVSNALVRAVTFFGSVPAGVLVSAAAVGVMRRRPRLAAQVVVGAVGGVGAELVVKRFYRRKRPTLLAHLEHVSSTSFPSGHSMAASSLYLTLGFVATRHRFMRRHRALVIAGSAAFASLIGATRVYLGVHWPTDVLGGLALGTAWACGAEAGFDVSGAERLEREAARPQAA